jgi:hypothetical protein
VLKANLSQTLIVQGDLLYPTNRWCKAGHLADSSIIVDGKSITMRFFKVVGDALAKEHHGIYCEKCMITANMMAKTPNKLGL